MRKHFNSFIQILGNQNVLLQDLKAYNIDWTNKYMGRSEVVLTPTSTLQVSQILAYCNANNLPVVPQAGNTGLVGGAVPLNDEIIISTNKMQEIYSFEEHTGVLTAQAGCILQNLNDYLVPFKHQMPWDIGARGSCQLGGNIATNAGGLNVVRYGTLRNYILGLEVVLPNGNVLNLMNTNRKDNTGFDLKQMFIGSEGTMGIITKSNVLTVHTPEQKQLFFLELDTYEQIMEVMGTAKKFESLSAFEMMEGRIMTKSAALPSNSSIRPPFAFDAKKFYVIAEFAGQTLDVDNICTQLMKHTEQIVINSNQTEYNTLWRWRESIAEVLCKLGFTLKYDLSIPPDKFDWFVNQVYPDRSQTFNAYYGHVGDGNIHFNIIFDTLDELHAEQERVELQMLELVKSLKGSISAEHGIGQHKRKYMKLQKGETSLEILRNLKKQFDPNNIMNPGKVY